ncbi:MAG TPA: hypothetical protein VHT25_09345 [Solirubrobacteraceae bacterium]|jgi:hypothetical protein|nr:hypothetical protein [Solirubrobacteraceae bacterium]
MATALNSCREAEALMTSGVLALPGRFATAAKACDVADDVLRAVPVENDLPPLEVLGDFVIPPIDGPASRDFQTLHFDFGVPLNPLAPGDVARYTVLHVPASTPRSAAITRLVPLRALLGQISWDDRDVLLSRFASYGRSHGAWDDVAGYTEGSLARIVEAASGGPPQLPSVKANPDFLCGTEFAGLTDELDFFDSHGLSVLEAQRDLTIDPGAIAIFDNLALAHGRQGRRNPGELHQRVYGHRALDTGRQRELRDRSLAAFSSAAAVRWPVTRTDVSRDRRPPGSHH